MEFLVYLSPIGNEIVQNLVKSKFTFRENIGLCSNQHIYGYVEDSGKKFVVCTKNIKRREVDVASMVNETIYHEATHAAQICRGYNTLGIQPSKMNLNPIKKANLKNSLSVTNSDFNNLVFKMEHEAYWLEDKPKIVKHYVLKNCLNY